MLEKFKTYFIGNKVGAPLAFNKEGQVSDEALQVATVVLLMEVAGADHSIAEEEAIALCEVMSDEFDLPDELMPHLVEVAVASRRETGRINDFVHQVNEHFDEHQKERILAMAWKIVLADDRVEKEEERTMLQIQTRLKLSDAVSERARRSTQFKKP